MKKLVICVFLISILTVLGCAGSGVSVGNGQEEFVLEVDGVRYGAGQISTAFFDVTSDSYDAAQAKLTEKPQNEEGGEAQASKAESPQDQSEVDIEGKKTGGATVSTEEDTLLGAKAFAVLFKKLGMRDGFPIFDDGEVQANLYQDKTTIRGQLSADGLKIGKHLVGFFLEYDLYKEFEYWQGTMEGVIEVDGKEFPVNHDYDAPILYSAKMLTPEIDGGGVARAELLVASNSPLSNSWYEFNGPKGILWTAGAVDFEQIEPGQWKVNVEEDVSKYWESGTYSFTEIVVENEAELDSMAWKGISFKLTGTETPDTPQIVSVNRSTSKIRGSGDFTIKVRVKGRTPPSRFHFYLATPGVEWSTSSNGDVTRLASNLWEVTHTEEFTEWATNGTYHFKDFVVENEGLVDSAPHSGTSVSVTGNRRSNPPKVLAASLDTRLIRNGGTVKATFIVESDAPISQINYYYESPLKAVSTGAVGEIRSLGGNRWEIVDSIEVSEYAPSGTYTVSEITASSEAFLESPELRKSLQFEVKNARSRRPRPPAAGKYVP